MGQVAPPWTPQQQYKFTGILNDLGEPHQELSFYVLAGTGSPTPTAGWTKVNNIDRPRRKGFTMPEGFDPLGLDVPIRFEATVNYGDFGFTPAQIEKNIQILEWMAGRGQLYKNGTHPAQGNPPIVQVASYFTAGKGQSNLIPPNFQQPWIPGWLISGLQYDQNAIRGPDGDRRRQDIVVSLAEYVAVPGAPQSPSQRQPGRNPNPGYKTFTTTQATDTIAKVCQAHGINQASKWTQVVQYNATRLKVRSYNQRLKVGTQVRVPNSILFNR